MEDISNEADTGSEQDTESPTAGTQEHQIPKHRFDEVNQQKRSLEEENRALRAILERQAQPQQNQQQEPQIKFDELGLDEQTGRAVLTLIDKVSTKRVQETAGQLQRQIAIQANQIEEQAFLNEYGHDKKGLLPAIRERKKRHAQQYNAYIPIEDAYKLVIADQQLSRGTRKATGGQAQVQQQQQTQVAAEQDEGTGFPNPENTRRTPANSGAAGGGARKTADDMSLEELEAQLDGQLSAGSLI